MSTTLRRFWTWMNADRKRFSVACFVALFGLLLWSRLILVSNLPRTAIADDEPKAAQVLTVNPETIDSTTSPSELSDNPSGESTQADLDNVPKAEPRKDRKRQSRNAGQSDSSREGRLE